ncbi:glycosyl hydrolase family 61 domain-containing protein [Sarocladium implicatum]|nr:glycosyl hydrolase family 61 domain-containing protein [Sarocladium implicatum]
MKAGLTLLALGAVANAHYTIPRISAGGVSGSDWQYTRTTANFQSNAPVENLNSDAMTCYERNPGTPAPGTLDVQAGQSVTFGINPNLYHPGPVNVYMAKAPSTAASFNGKGNVWFKIFNDQPRTTSSEISWPNYNQASQTVTIPSCIANGEYLIRFEQIGLHSAGAPQLYISCSQVRVTGGSGSASPNLLSFPGSYSMSDPGLSANIWWPIPTNYKAPGGDALKC